MKFFCKYSEFKLYTHLHCKTGNLKVPFSGNGSFISDFCYSRNTTEESSFIFVTIVTIFRRSYHGTMLHTLQSRLPFCFLFFFPSQFSLTLKILYVFRDECTAEAKCICASSSSFFRRISRQGFPRLSFPIRRPRTRVFPAILSRTTHDTREKHARVL